jgi:uncharacterized protein GlcG (DUF336 family)
VTPGLAAAYRIVEAVHAEAARRSILVSAAIVAGPGGGVGVSGASAEDDAACPEAGLQAF